MEFELPKEQSSIIKVIGVGGGGGNAVNYMYENGIVGVNFVICNTDAQALEISPIPNKIQLGPEITQGLGAGSRPQVGAEATEESAAEIRAILEKNTKMAFITAGMGGGTGTGGAPVIAKIARDMGILTVGIVTTPFSFEGRRKLIQADEGIKQLKEHVDTILIISNDKIREIYGNLTRSEAFANADNILCTAAKSISEIITVPGEINVDFADVEYVMQNSGVAIMGNYTAEGENRAMRCVQGALNSPLLNDNDISGAKNILINITSGNAQVTIDEITEINDYVQEASGNDADLILGVCDDPSLGDKITLTVIATGFSRDDQSRDSGASDRVVHSLTRTVTPTPAPVAETPPTLTEVTRDEMKLVNNDDATENKDEMFVKSETPELPEIEKEEIFAPEIENNIEDQPKDPDGTLDFELKIVDKPVDKPEEQQLSFYVSNSKEKKQPTETPKTDPQDDRKKILRDLSYKWNNASNLSELENQPAYKRKGVNLEDQPHSSDEDVSRYTLDEGDEGRPEIRKNNSFLHDNVD